MMRKAHKEIVQYASWMRIMTNGVHALDQIDIEDGGECEEANPCEVHAVEYHNAITSAKKHDYAMNQKTPGTRQKGNRNKRKNIRILYE